MGLLPTHGPPMHPSDNAQCFSSHMGLYAIEPMVLRGLVAEAKARRLAEHPVDQPTIRTEQVAVPGQAKTVAVIPFHGPVTKKRSKMSEASAIELRAAIRQASKDPTVDKIVLHIDSPGGAVGGIDDLAAEVREAKKLKPVVAYIEDLGASAAYWVASQATEIVANRGAFVGSLGVYGVIHDTSGAYEREGIKVHVVSSGGAKGKGVAGVPVDETTLSEERRLIEAITDLFKLNVREGRKLTHAATTDLFDGRVHMAGKALELGLIDRIGTFESAILGAEEEEPANPTNPLFAEWPEEDEKPEDRKPAKDDESEGEEEEEDMPMKDEKKSEATATSANAINVDADYDPSRRHGPSPFDTECANMAAEAKAAGCPLTIESITGKLKAAGTMAEATKVFMVLREMKPTVGSMAPTGSQPDASKTPATAFAGKSKQELESAFAALVKKHRDAGLKLQEATLAAKNENPELHTAYVTAWQKR